MQGQESLRQSSVWMIAGQMAAIAAQAVYFIFIGRALGSGEYGAFVGVAALIAALSQFSSLGMEMILVRNVSRDSGSYARTWGQALGFSAAGFFVVLAVAVGFSKFALRPDVGILVPWIAVADGLLGKLVQLASRAFQGAGRLAWTARLTALNTTVRAGAAGGVWLGARAHVVQPTALLWAKVYGMATFSVALFALTLATIELGWPRFARLRRADLSEGLSFSLSSSSISIYNDIDKTFLVSVGETYAAGIYSAAYRMVDAASAPIYAIHAAAAPHFFREGMQGARSAGRFARATLRRTLPYSICAAVTVAVAAPLVPECLGASFRGSAEVMRWICILPVLRAFHYSWGSAITASASQWNRTATQFGAAALNLCLNVLLIPRWSWQGAAAASLATEGALAVASYVVLARLAAREERSAEAEAAVSRGGAVSVGTASWRRRKA